MDGQRHAPAVLCPGKRPCTRFTGGLCGTKGRSTSLVPHAVRGYRLGAFYLMSLYTAKIHSVLRWMRYEYGAMVKWRKHGRSQTETCPRAIWFMTNPTWTDLGSGPGNRSERRYVRQITAALANNVFAADGPLSNAVFPTCTALQRAIQFPHTNERTWKMNHRSTIYFLR